MLPDLENWNLENKDSTSFCLANSDLDDVSSDVRCDVETRVMVGGEAGGIIYPYHLLRTRHCVHIVVNLLLLRDAFA